jgi:hypothetical protein
VELNDPRGRGIVSALCFTLRDHRSLPSVRASDASGTSDCHMPHGRDIQSRTPSRLFLKPSREGMVEGRGR